MPITSYKVQICELGEVLEHHDLNLILDTIVQDYNYTTSSLLDSVAVTEVVKDGAHGCTLPIGEQYRLIQDYISRVAVLDYCPGGSGGWGGTSNRELVRLADIQGVSYEWCNDPRVLRMRLIMAIIAL